MELPDRIVIWGQQDSPNDLRSRLIDYLTDLAEDADGHTVKIMFIVTGAHHYDRDLDAPIFIDMDSILQSYQSELYLMRHKDDPRLFPYFSYTNVKFIGDVFQLGPVLMIPGYVPLDEVKVDHGMYKSMGLDLQRVLKHISRSDEFDNVSIVVAGDVPHIVPPVSLDESLEDVIDEMLVDEYISMRSNLTFIYKKLKQTNGLSFWITPYHTTKQNYKEELTEFQFLYGDQEFSL